MSPMRTMQAMNGRQYPTAEFTNMTEDPGHRDGDADTHVPKQSSAAANDALALTLTGVGAHFDPPCRNANASQTLASCNEVSRDKRDASDEDLPDLDLEANACATLHSCFESKPFALIDWDDDGFSCFNVGGECDDGGTEITSEKSRVGASTFSQKLFLSEPGHA
ncbi:hypothetical protein CGGC5_v015995 [Colletotrichum fructicola Nara gc5]|uniref:Uncharacterized protein n=1 Tax=Colletotrichum fructicola (strain Nara gc5) TaxID=1213859 RepID=A0A7J6IIZ9_COLFN|nr:hypothetical protein CGGC5_v015995 [Colletotrichum fructicola Nara gc5]